MELLDYLPYVFLVPAVVQIFYYLVFFSRFAFAKPVKKEPKKLPPISVIVCGRNEEENFKHNLPKLFLQDYPQYEVIAVNDQSIDNSKEVLEEIQKHHANMHIVDVMENDRFWRGKKYGLTLGIKRATYEHMLFIDADCIPASNNWIREMASGFDSPQKEIVLGFGAYQKKRSLLNLLIRYETLHTAIQYFSYAMMKMPYMGIGRNLAYVRPLFYRHKGFVPHMHIPMGDDDLFVNTAATPTNTSVVFSKDSFTYSIPEIHYADWFVQKRRHMAAGTRYKGVHKVLLATYGANQILFYLSLIGLAIYWPVPVWIWYLLGLKLLLQYTIFFFSSRKTGDWEVLLLLPFLELFLVVNQIFILLANSVNKGYKWK
jgi:glycosyltransferase involved in cell wall biosynthesis